MVNVYNKKGCVYLSEPAVFKSKKLQDVDLIYDQLCVFLQSAIKNNALSLAHIASSLGFERTGAFHKLSNWMRTDARKKMDMLSFLKLMEIQGFHFELKITNGKKPFKHKGRAGKVSVYNSKKYKTKQEPQPL